MRAISRPRAAVAAVANYATRAARDKDIESPCLTATARPVSGPVIEKRGTPPRNSRDQREHARTVSPTTNDVPREKLSHRRGERKDSLIKVRRLNVIKISFLIKIGGEVPRRDYPRPASRIMFAINNLFGANEPPNIYGPTRARARNKISRLCR